MGNGNPPMPDQSSLLTLHSSGTLFLLVNPRTYRDIEVHISNKNGQVVHEPPRWQAVPGLMQSFFRHLSSCWTTGDALDVASYALWAINWIHPFRNGNGRTARAFSYACLCLKLGVLLPGAPTVIDQIMLDRVRYEHALRVADGAFTASGMPDLAPMKAFLSDLLAKQIASVVPASAGSPGQVP